MNTEENGIEDKSTLKQVIAVRTDLKMGKGKIASQVAHASLCAFLRAEKSVQQRWIKEGAAKIVVKVKNEKELFSLYTTCKAKGLPCCIIKDAAKTQLKEPTYTALGIGPALGEIIDKITGHLKLL